jgi:hypothetical protein
VDSEKSVVASGLLPGADSRENPNRQIIDAGATILPQRCGQRARRIKSMSARSGQAGTVYRFRDNWIGAWPEDMKGNDTHKMTRTFRLIGLHNPLHTCYRMCQDAPESGG